MKISKRVNSVPASGIRKFFDVVSQMEGVISLGVGEPDFTTPLCIREACISSIENGVTSYTSNYGLMELREALSEHIERKCGIKYDPARQLIITAGVSEGIDLALRAIIDPGEEVIVPEPCFVSYKPCVIFAGGVPVTICTGPETGFTPSPEDVEAAVTPRTRAIMLSFPSNPTGGVMSRSALQDIVDIAVRHDLYIITDEIYDMLVYGVEHTCVAALDGAYDRTIYLNGFSKAYAMTGWRVGYAAAHPDVLEAMMKIHQYILMCAPVTAQIAAIEALKNGEKDMRDMVSQYDERRRIILRGLNKIGLDCYEPKGAFYVFPCIGKSGLSSEEFAARLLNEQKVAVVPGTAFGECGEGFVRCSYANSIPNIQEAVDRMERFLAGNK